jgi:hypothetical protein
MTRRHLVLSALRDEATFTVDDPRFSTARVVGPSMLSRDGAEHARHREPFARPWRKAAICEGFEAWVREEAQRLVTGIASFGAAELRTALSDPLAAAAMRRALALEYRSVAGVLSWSRDIVGAVSAVSAGNPCPRPARTRTPGCATRSGTRSVETAGDILGCRPLEADGLAAQP